MKQHKTQTLATLFLNVSPDIVDPYLDVAKNEENKPVEVLEAVLEEHSQQFTPRWIGVGGNEHAPR